jgi:cyanocobalamin reductase (cyanide-eliminating) / alkylcobalamin dealkylase
VIGNVGFDLVCELDLAWLEIGRTGRALLVGNTRALWPIFLAARRADPALLAAPDPLDTYTERELARAFPGAEIWFAHRQYDGAYLPFQRFAVTAGLGALAPTNLVIHPIFGPWFGLRALVVVDGEPPSRKPSLPYRCSNHCTLADTTADWRSWLAVRDACCVGREHRYSEDQLAYHYTKDLRLLL